MTKQNINTIYNDFFPLLQNCIERTNISKNTKSFVFVVSRNNSYIYLCLYLII